MPDPQLVFPWRDIAELKGAGGVGEGVMGVILHDDPGGHPVVHITGHTNDLRLGKGFRDDFFELRLGGIKGRILLTIGMNIVQDAVTVFDINGCAGRNKQDVGSVDAVTLVNCWIRRGS